MFNTQASLTSDTGTRLHLDHALLEHECANGIDIVGDRFGLGETHCLQHQSVSRFIHDHDPAICVGEDRWVTCVNLFVVQLHRLHPPVEEVGAQHHLPA
jgi:hypothetical protein